VNDDDDSFDEAHFVDLFGANASVFTKRSQKGAQDGLTTSMDLSHFSTQSMDYMFNALDTNQDDRITKVVLAKQI
jgi:hypothetical protein